MALRPGSRLLISSHFIPLPRNSIINASSSGDHFDCFLAGDSEMGAGRRRLAGTDGRTLAVAGGNGATVVGVAWAVIGAVTGKSGLGGKADDVVTGVASSSSFCGFSSSEISTLAGGSTGWFCTAIICAIHREARGQRFTATEDTRVGGLDSEAQIQSPLGQADVGSAEKQQKSTQKPRPMTITTGG